jgi:hypothetical protein
MRSALKRLFLDHPASVGETYLEHARHAAFFAATLFRASLAAGIHAVFPEAFESTASRSVAELHRRMVVNRSRLRSTERTVTAQADFIGEQI